MFLEVEGVGVHNSLWVRESSKTALDIFIHALWINQVTEQQSNKVKHLIKV